MFPPKVQPILRAIDPPAWRLRFDRIKTIFPRFFFPPENPIRSGNGIGRIKFLPVSGFAKFPATTFRIPRNPGPNATGRNTKPLQKPPLETAIFRCWLRRKTARFRSRDEHGGSGRCPAHRHQDPRQKSGILRAGSEADCGPCRSPHPTAGCYSARRLRDSAFIAEKSVGDAAF